jgi:signal transduction histidine kinase
LTLSIRDDGIGFDVASIEESYAQRGSLGLLNMKERAELAHGKLTIDSKIGKGTKVTLVMPLEMQTPES